MDKDQARNPSGAIPRLMLISLLSEALEFNTARVSLGFEAIEAAVRVGITSFSGGRTGAMPRFRSQVRRLMACRLKFRPSLHSNWLQVFEHPYADLLASTAFDEMSTSMADTRLFSHLQFNVEFLDYCRRNKSLGRWDEIEQLKGSPIALDLYAYLCQQKLRAKRNSGLGLFVGLPCFSGALSRKKERESVITNLAKVRQAAPELVEQTIGFLIKEPRWDIVCGYPRAYRRTQGGRLV